jgi:hypothetical protein
LDEFKTINCCTNWNKFDTTQYKANPAGNCMENTNIIIGIIVFMVLWVEACCSFKEGWAVNFVVR